MAIQIHSFQFNAFQENSFLVWDENKNCVIIDPGCYSTQEQNEFIDFINENELKPIALLNTHAHIDHVLGNAFVKNNFEIDYYLHNEDLVTLKSVDSYAHLYGFEGYLTSPEPNKILSHNQRLTFGEIEITVYHTPGHAPGHVVFHFQNDGFVINGDVLFKGSFGRVDLPGGNIEVLKKSIFDIMFALPENTTIYCGHGPETDVATEKKSNYIHQF